MGVLKSSNIEYSDEVVVEFHDLLEVMYIEILNRWRGIIIEIIHRLCTCTYVTQRNDLAAGDDLVGAGDRQQTTSQLIITMYI